MASSLYQSRVTVQIKADAEHGPAIPDTRLVFVGKAEYLRNTKEWLAQLDKRLGPIAPEIVEQAVVNACESDAEEAWNAKSKMVTSQLDNAVVICLPSKLSSTSSQSGSYFLFDLIRKVKHQNNSISVVVVAPRNDVLALASVAATAIPDYNAASKAKTVNMDISAVVLDQNGRATGLYDDDVSAIQNVVDGVRRAAALVDLPANLLNVDAFVGHARDVAGRVGASVEVLRMAELKDRGFGGIVSVGQAAEEEPALVVLTHHGSDPSKTVALVGKGIVYDTGGLQMKTKQTMPGMKVDMGGAAACLNAFEALALNGFRHKLHVLLCLADNAVGPKAPRPDDVITMYSGKTVEITNTDAEGRVVMGDGAAYAAKDLRADVIVSMATLTGAASGAVGQHHGAVTSNSDQVMQAAIDASRNSCDQAYSIIFCPELHLPQLKSEVADMINSNLKYPGASSSVAALFVGAQFNFDRPWMNVDMASPATVNRRGTGYGVALLCTMFGRLTTNRLLQDVAPDYYA